MSEGTGGQSPSAYLEDTASAPESRWDRSQRRWSPSRTKLRMTSHQHPHPISEQHHPSVVHGRSPARPLWCVEKRLSQTSETSSADQVCGNNGAQTRGPQLCRPEPANVPVEKQRETTSELRAESVRRPSGPDDIITSVFLDIGNNQTNMLPNGRRRRFHLTVIIQIGVHLNSSLTICWVWSQVIREADCSPVHLGSYGRWTLQSRAWGRCQLQTHQRRVRTRLIHFIKPCSHILKVLSICS